MKKIKILLIVNILVFLFLGIYSKSIAYDRAEVTLGTEYTEYEEGEEPAHYDVIVDLNHVIDNETIPYFKSSVDEVLYKEHALFSVDFLDPKKQGSSTSGGTSSDTTSSTSGDTASSKSDEEKWNVFRDVVSVFFHIFLYIGEAILLTLLIYIGLLFVLNSINGKDVVSISLGGIFQDNKGNSGSNNGVKKAIASKRFIEQWLISVIAMALVAFAINLTISVSDTIEKEICDLKVGDSTTESTQTRKYFNRWKHYYNNTEQKMT